MYRENAEVLHLIKSIREFRETFNNKIACEESRPGRPVGFLRGTFLRPPRPRWEGNPGGFREGWAHTQLSHLPVPFSVRKIVRRGEAKPSPSLAVQLPQRQAGTHPGVVSSAHPKGLEVFSQRQDRGSPGTGGCWGGRSGSVHPKCWGVLGRGRRASSPSWRVALLSPPSGHGLGSHFGPSGSRAGEEVLR